MRAAQLSVTALLVALVAACNAYNPNLPDTPFRCGDSDPRCPEGYECVSYSPSQKLCEREGSTGVDGGSTFNCADDNTIEPNNEISMATPTPIPMQDTSFSLVGVAICPAEDIDVFRFGVDLKGRNLRTDISFDAVQAPLALEVYNANETMIRNGAMVGNNAGLIRAEVPNMPAGDYYVIVKGGGTSLENNYSIEIEISGP